MPKQPPDKLALKGTYLQSTKSFQCCTPEKYWEALHDEDAVLC